MAAPTGTTGSPQPPLGQDDQRSVEGLKRLGKYELQKKLGAGGMGAVFLALDTQLKRTVALKVLPHDKAQNPSLVKRFHSEARAAAQLRHDNIVTVYEAGEADGYNFIALEFIDGIDVADLVQRREVIPVRRATNIIKQAAQALQHAYEAGIVHRDIKPANLMIRRDGVVKLTDMGLARAVDDTSQTNITRAGTTVGTVDYMAPEQAQNSKAADTRSDIYSLGCTWFHMLTGQVPFPDGSLTNKLQAHATKPPPDPRTLNPKIPEAVIAVLNRMMAKKPEDRYQTPTELIDDLERSRNARESVAESVLAALADDDSSTSTTTSASKSNPDSSSDSPFTIPVYKPTPATTKPTASEMPQHRAAKSPVPIPRREKSATAVVREEQQERDYTKLLYVGAGLLVIGVIVGLAWLVQNYASTVDSQPIVIPNRDRQAADDKSLDSARAITSTSTSTDPDVQQITSQDRTQPGDNTISQPTAKNIGETLISKTPDRSGSTTEIKSSGTGKGAIIGSGGTSVGTRELSFQKDFPVWVGEQRQPRNLPQVVVNPGNAGPNVYPTLKSALDAAPASGVEIVLIGIGPFPLRPVAVSGKVRVVIRGQGTERPLIVLLPPRRSADVSSVIHFSRGSLELSGVDLALDTRTFPSDKRIAAVQISSGHLFVENCSLAVVGPSKPEMVAIQFDDLAAADSTDRAAFSPRILISRSSVRGQHLIGLLCQSASLDAVVRDSLFVTREAPPVQFDQAASVSDSDGRSLLVAFSTLSSSSRAFVFSTRDAGQRVRTDVKVLNTIVAAEPGAADPTLLTLDGWPRADASSLLANFITWKSTGTAFRGWKKLAWIQPDGLVAAASPADWQKRWKEGGDPAQFVSDAWPKSSLDDLVKLNTDDLKPETANVTVAKSTGQGHPGCPLDGLHFGDLTPLPAAIDQSVRPDLPASLLQITTDSKLVRVDVTKQDLGKFLATQRLDAQTIIVATGSGAQTTSPISVEGNRLHVRFEQDPDRPLMLMPKSAPGAKDSAMFSVTKGSLELENANLVAFPPDKPTPDKPAAPTWFIQASDSDVVLRHCRVQAPMLSNTGNRGLIRWTRSDGATQRELNADIDHHLALFDSFLLGTATLLDIDMRRRGVFIRNSVLASRDNVFTFNLGSQAPDISSVLDLEASTLSAGDSVFKVQSGSLSGPVSNPLSVFVEKCVFGPSIKPGTGKLPPVTLLMYQGPVLEQRQLAWWERDNAYASDIAYFVQAMVGEKPVAAQAVGPAWQQLWGANRILRPLTGDNAVKFDGDLPPNRGKLEPDDFELSPRCKAASWIDGQYAVGADVSAMKLPDLRSESGTVKVPKKTKSKTPIKPKPGF